MSPLNYVWYQYRWLRLAAKMFEVDGEDGLVRLWDCFHSTDRVNASEATAASLALVFHDAWLLSGAPERKNAPELG